MDDMRKVLQIAAAIILVAAAGVGLYLYFSALSRKAGKEAVDKPSVLTMARKTTGAYALPEPLDLPNLTLETSDEVLRRIVQDISSHPLLSQWFQTKELVRKFVAAVDNISNGLSPRPHIDFFSPKGDFRAVSVKGIPVVDPEGYTRYDLIPAVFISLDTKSGARLYAALLPIFRQAYKELGYPDRDFQDTTAQAIIELLKTPVLEGRIPLEKKISSYVYADETIEGLSAAQKHLLRMGPENVQVIQKKLREMAEAIGIPENRLPKPRFITSGTRD
jgi:hypothetical protein